MREKNRQWGGSGGYKEWIKGERKKTLKKVVYLKSQLKTDCGAERKTKITQFKTD